MDFTTLQSEFLSRGFDYLSDGGTGTARLKRWLNDAYHEINQAADWPYLETSTASAAPVTIADLRKVLTVNDATNRLPLRPTTRRWLVTTFGDIASVTGIARFYWVENGVVRVYPVSGVSTTVYYLKVPADLSAGADVPVIPARFHDLIVDGAVRRGYEDREEFDAAQALSASMAQRLDNMRSLLITQSRLPDLDDQAETLVEPQPQQTGAP